MTFIIRPAERRQAKLRLALVGVSGCGKTTGAINIASGMGGKFVIIDTERKSADLYASMAKYDVLCLDKPYTPERYIEAINLCEKSGYQTIIIDSLSHAWSGEGGVLDMQDAATQASRNKNSYTAWKEVTPWHNRLVETILQSDAHIIATMRAKTHYEIVDDNGKKRPIKVGLAPVQREGLDYEFTVVLDLDKDSKIYTSSKDRTRLFEGRHDKINRETGVKLLSWLNDGRSNEEIEKEEVNLLKEKIKLSSSIDSLRDECKIAIQKYPHFKDEFIQMGADHKKILENGGMH